MSHWEISRFTTILSISRTYRCTQSGSSDDIDPIASSPLTDTYFFNEGQWLDLDNNDIREEECAEDVELERIDVVTWEKNNGLWVVW